MNKAGPGVRVRPRSRRGSFETSSCSPLFIEFHLYGFHSISVEFNSQCHSQRIGRFPLSTGDVLLDLTLFLLILSLVLILTPLILHSTFSY